MKNVLVTSGETRMALAICRVLSSNGYRVFAGSNRPFSMTAASRHCAGSMVYASPFTKQHEFIENINNFAKKNNIGILLPVLEETFTIAKNRTHLGKSMALAIPEYSGILAVHDKGNLAVLGSKLGILVPNTLELGALLSGQSSLSSLTFPVLLKPKQGGGGWGMEKFASADTLLDFIQKQKIHPERYIVQEILEGRQVCACALYQNGTFLGGDAYRPLHSWPLGCGQATIRETVFHDQALLSLRTLLDHLGWHGVCEADFLVDSTGKAWLLDVNPRFWGSLGHNIDAGVPYPLYYCKMCEGVPFSLPPARAGTRTGWLGGDTMRFLLELYRANNRLYFLNNARLARMPVASYDDWVWNDPLPFFAWAIHAGLNALIPGRKDALPGIWE